MCCVVFTAVNSVRTWALDREVFQNIMRRTAETRQEQYRNFLRRLTSIVLRLIHSKNPDFNRHKYNPVVLLWCQSGLSNINSKLMVTYFGHFQLNIFYSWTLLE